MAAGPDGAGLAAILLPATTASPLAAPFWRLRSVG
jgi:hypothetical protein